MNPQQRSDKMPTVMLPRYLRPRNLLLPLMFGVLLAPAFLKTSSASGTDADLRAGAVCRNAPPPQKLVTPPPPRPAPKCVNCRAPLLDAPLAQADRETTMPPIVALPPTA